MLSFTLESRYLSDYTMEITVPADTEIAVYYDNQDPITSSGYTPGVGDHSAYYRYTFDNEGSTGIESFLIKVVARGYSYNYQDGWITVPLDDPYCDPNDLITDQVRCELTGNTWIDTETIPNIVTADVDPSISIKLPDFTGSIVTYELVDGVEEYIRQGLPASGYIDNVVIGNKFSADTSNERTDASVPLAARASIQAAADENPTENRVFDVTLLLEKIMQDFTNLRDDVKDKVYDILVIDQGLFKSTKVADMVWDLLDKYGFGTVERIINFFSTEENQNRLANIILGDDDLQTELNYNSGSLNYLAVAKVGVLVFADYIHDTYINATLNPNNGWRESLWNGIMTLLGRSGDTLVDIVSDLWTMTANAITAVKAGITEFVEGVKSGLEYLTIEAIKLMLETVEALIYLILVIIKEMVNVFSPNAISEVNGLFYYEGKPFGMIVADLSIELYLFDKVIYIDDTFLNTEMSVDTLSVGLWALGSSVLHIGFNYLVIKLADKGTRYSIGAIIGNIIAQLVIGLYLKFGEGINPIDKPTESRELSSFYFLNTFIMAVSFIISLISASKTIPFAGLLKGIHFFLSIAPLLGLLFSIDSITEALMFLSNGTIAGFGLLLAYKLDDYLTWTKGMYVTKVKMLLLVFNLVHVLIYGFLTVLFM